MKLIFYPFNIISVVVLFNWESSITRYYSFLRCGYSQFVLDWICRYNFNDFGPVFMLSCYFMYYEHLTSDKNEFDMLHQTHPFRYFAAWHWFHWKRHMMVMLCNQKVPSVDNELHTVAIWLATELLSWKFTFSSYWILFELKVLPTYSIYFDSASSTVIESHLVWGMYSK